MKVYYLTPSIDYELSSMGLKKILEKVSIMFFEKYKNRGDIPIIFNHCDILNKNGIEAIPIVIDNRFGMNLDWFYHDTAAQRMGRDFIYNICDDDVLICPSTMCSAISLFSKGKKFLFVQNYSKYSIGSAEVYNYDGIITLKGYCEDYIKQYTKVPVYSVLNGIDLKLYNCKVPQKNKNSVLILYRKNMEIIDKFLKDMPQKIKDYFVFDVKYKHLHTQVLIEEYKKHDIYLTLSYPEGFSLTPLEAMACGCIVGGFTGGGGSLYMKNEETALVVEDGDINGIYKILERIIDGEEIKEKLRINSLKKVKEFSLEAMEQSLLSVFDNITTKKSDF